MLQENTVYRFKDEFCTALKIPMNQAERRTAELLEWLTNFFTFDFLPGHPHRIHVKEIFGEYQPLPHKPPKQKELNAKKQADAEKFVLEHVLTPEGAYTSKCRAARQYIDGGGKQKYHLTSDKYVAQKYMKPVFEEYGEETHANVWVWYLTYEPLSLLEYQKWRTIQNEEKIDEQRAAAAFYRFAQGEDISEELNYFQRAIERMQEIYGDFPVLSGFWRLKESEMTPQQKQEAQDKWVDFTKESHGFDF